MLKTSLALSLIVLGLVYIGFSFLIQHLLSDIARASFLTGLLGGVLCVFWGIQGYLGFRARGWAILTLAVVSFIMLSQTVTAWLGAGAPAFASILITLMFILSIALLIWLAYSGQFAASVASTPPSAPVSLQHTKS